eukprot:GHVR01016926.1.p1 GENE.GHVR01016926.1~~GHVR01016926.1.p1  ORF type:complete len:346 (+),score=83.47 GHVR01016926.1:310-1347(+)
MGKISIGNVPDYVNIIGLLESEPSDTSYYTNPIVEYSVLYITPLTVNSDYQDTIDNMYPVRIISGDNIKQKVDDTINRVTHSQDKHKYLYEEGTTVAFSVVYFKGDFVTKFDRKSTRPGVCNGSNYNYNNNNNNNNNNDVDGDGDYQCDLMHQISEIKYASYDYGSILCLEYEYNKQNPPPSGYMEGTWLVVGVPNAEGDFTELGKTLAHVDCDTLDVTPVDLKFPRLNIHKVVNLTDSLLDSALAGYFDKGSLENIATGTKLDYVDQLIVFDVDDTVLNAPVKVFDEAVEVVVNGPFQLVLQSPGKVKYMGIQVCSYEDILHDVRPDVNGNQNNQNNQNNETTE